MNNNTKKHKKINFAEKKSIAIKSIKEVDCFLSKFNNVLIIKKLLKK